MIRIKSGRHAEEPSKGLANNRIFFKSTALSLSIVACGLLGVNRASASDVPLPLKAIGLNSDNQIVIYFGKREGEFPSPPHLLETPGPNHRITMEFNDSVVDKVNMPAAGDLSTKLHKELAAIKSVRYSTINAGDTPKARVVIELPELVKVRPRVVKLEEESVTINLADDIVEQSANFEEPSKSRVQSMEGSAPSITVARRQEPAASAIAPKAETVSSEVADSATAAPVAVSDTAVKSAPLASTEAETSMVAQNSEAVATPEASATAATAPAAVQADKVAKASEVTGSTPAMREPPEDQATATTSIGTTNSTSSISSTSSVDPGTASAVKTKAVDASDAPSQLAESQSTSPKAKPSKEPLVKMPESLANASANLNANLKKIMRWPHKDDANKTAVAPKPASAKSKSVVSKAPSPEEVNKLATSDTAPDGAEFNAASSLEQRAASTDSASVAETTKSASTTVATAPATSAPAPAATDDSAAAPGGFDWTSNSKPAAAASTTVTEAAQAPAESAKTTEVTHVATSAFTAEPAPTREASSTPAAVTSAVETPALAQSETVATRTDVAQMPESVPDDKPKISTPIETTETHTFNEPAQVVQTGASTTMTEGAANIIKAKKDAQEVKPVTVAETESSDFADVLKPGRKAARAEAEPAADTTTTPLIRDSEMEDPAEKTTPKTSESVETPAETPKAAAAVAPPVSEGSKTSVNLYNSAVKAHLSGNLPKAIQDYQGALAVNPELAEAHSNLGLIYNQQHNYAQAVSEFRKALAINPKDAITYNGIGAALRAQKDLVGAIKNWQTAVSLDPKLATAHYNLGVAYELQRDYDKALASYDEAVKCDYRLGEAYYRMGLIMDKRHRNDEAKAKFKAALKAGENSDYSADARQRLALLESGKSDKTAK